MQLSRLFLGVSCLVSINSAMASGYALKLYSGKHAGMAAAGSGVSDDALTAYVNPAAMILSKTHQLAFHVTGVFPYVKFSGSASAPAFAPVVLLAFSATGKTGNAGEEAAVPSIGIIAKPTENTRVGLTITTPYGLKFNYGTHSLTKAHTTWASLISTNISPAIAVRFTDWLTVASAMQIQYAEVKFNRKATLTNEPALAPFPSTYVSVRGSDWTMGWMAGILLEPFKALKVGLSYRSKMIANIDGRAMGSSSRVSSLLLDSAPQFFAAAKIRFPHVATFSSSYDLTSKLTAYLDFVYTWWNTVNHLGIRLYLPPASSNKTVSEDITTLNWKNSWFLSMGANYKFTDSWSFRAGYGYDKSPTRNGTRIIAIPDSNKHWIALGVTHTWGRIDTTLSYGHEFFQKNNIVINPPTYTGGFPTTTQLKGSLNGKIKSHVDLVSLQMNFKIG